jgi:hypothetical protein
MGRTLGKLASVDNRKRERGGKGKGKEAKAWDNRICSSPGSDERAGPRE